MQSIVYPQVKHILNQLSAGLKTILGDKLIGIYLYGSLVTGDFDLGISDLDLVAVMTEELDEFSFAALHQLHQRVVDAYPDWDNRLELAYLSRHGLKTFRTQKSRIGIISPGEPFHQIDAGRDWLISWYSLRETGVALYGPPIKTLIDPISSADYIQAVQEHIQMYRHAAQQVASKSYLSYIVLTTVRGVYTVRKGHPTSKVKAAAWAKAAYPQWAEVIDKALKWRVSPQADALTPDDIRPQVQAYIHDMLKQLPDC